MSAQPFTISLKKKKKKVMFGWMLDGKKITLFVK